MAILTTYGAFRNSFATSATVAKDGYFEWPVANLGINGFVGLTTWGFTTFANVFPVTIHANGVLTADSVFGVDSYNFYVSQRTDTPASQYITVVQHPSSGTQSFSGSIDLSLSALATGVYDAGDEESVRRLLTGLDIYVQRLSDKSIQHFEPIYSIIGVI